MSGRAYPKLRSYSLNAFLGWIGEWDRRLGPEDGRGFPPCRVFRKHSEIIVAMPGGTFVFQDVNPNSICWPFFGVQMAHDYFFNWPNSSHNRSGVVSFADGHVDYHRWRDQRTIAAYSTDYHKHQDSSPNNADLVWPRARATTRK